MLKVASRRKTRKPIKIEVRNTVRLLIKISCRQTGKTTLLLRMIVINIVVVI